MIKIIAIGNVGKDAVVNQVNSGKKVINFTIAHTEKYKDNAGVQQSKAVWMECEYWTEKTSVAAYIKKGTSLYIEGQPESRAYTTANGECRSSLRVRIEKLHLLSSPNKTEGGQSESFNSPYATGNTNTTDINAPEPVDDLPF